MMHKRLKNGKRMPLLDYLKTRFVTPAELISGLRDPVYHLRYIGEDSRWHLNRHWFGMMLFNARYNSLKVIEGHDYWD